MAVRDDVLQLPSGATTSANRINLNDCRSADDLSAVITFLDKLVAGIQYQLSAWDLGRNADGTPMECPRDTMWPARARRAMGVHRALASEARRRLTALHVSEAAARGQSFEAAFMQAAKNWLPEPAYNNLLAAASNLAVKEARHVE